MTDRNEVYGRLPLKDQDPYLTCGGCVLSVLAVISAVAILATAAWILWR